MPGRSEEGVLGLYPEVWWLCRVDRGCDGSERLVKEEAQKCCAAGFDSNECRVSHPRGWSTGANRQNMGSPRVQELLALGFVAVVRV